jgi:hypothetical protein
MIKHYLIPVIFSVLLFSCASTNMMSLSVQQPAPVSIPPDVKTAGVIDRTRVLNENKIIDALHNVISLETDDLKKAGAQASVSGLTDELRKNEHFTNVKTLDAEDMRTFGVGVLPSPLSWDSVDRICRENNTDVLFSLELFDTESKVSYASNNVNTGIGNLSALEHYVNMTTQVKTGWRIYDPASRTILDEYLLSRDMVLSGKGINPVTAASSLLGKKEAVKNVSLKNGQAYAWRIIPNWIRVSREYFVRGNDNFKIAQRKAQSGNWDDAGRIWLEQTKSPDRTVAGRACYNMAISREINGDLDGAIRWAQKAYEDYRIRLALNYVHLLRNRKAEDEMLKNQQVASKE